MKVDSSISLPLPLLRNDAHTTQTELHPESLCNLNQPQYQPGLPAKGILGSALQPVSDTLYHYVGKNRTIDQTSTKNWRSQMRQLRFQILTREPWSYDGFDFKPAQNGFVTALGSDGKYHYLLKTDLQSEGFEVQSGTDDSAPELWPEEVEE